ncbi:hypothetical protein [Balnearium lithotrophicum]|nr:hypothetical protein [Balnearium lithotrophicum]
MKKDRDNKNIILIFRGRKFIKAKGKERNNEDILAKTNRNTPKWEEK